jgi:LCP family protein required for cell wall assembly
VISVNIVLVIVCLGSAWALGFYSKQFADIPRVALGDVLDRTTDASQPQNFLLVGVDNAEGLDPKDPVLNGRDAGENLSDSIMILRVDPNRKEAALLSLPRDLYVTIAGNHGKDKINVAMALGGGRPDLLIQTIQQDFGIQINHYLQVNFAAFRSLVDALDGVNIWFDQPARDANTGLNVTDSGCQTLDGVQALAYARSRHYTALINGVWTEDPTSDLGRIARQQYFIKQAAKKAIARGARNPIELNSLIGIAQQYMKIDDTLTPQQILDLGDKFNTFEPDDLVLYTPDVTGGWAGAASVLYLNEQAAKPIFDIFRGKNPFVDVNGATTVEVRNGTGRVGQGQSAADQLKARGFTITGVTDDRSQKNDTTVIRYAPGFLRSAVVVATYLDGNPTFQEDPSLASTSTWVAVVVGRDFTSVRDSARPLDDFKDELAKAEATATSAPATGPGATTSTTQAPSSTPIQSQSFVPHPDPNVPC